MAEIIIGIWTVYFSAMALGISCGFFLIVLAMVFKGRRGGFYRPAD